MKRYYYLIYLILILTACGTATTESAITAASNLQLDYTIGECDQDITIDQFESWVKADITVQDRIVRISQNLAYVCCAEIEIKVKQKEDIVKVILVNKGDICRCMCGYEVTTELDGLPSGSYTVQVWGVEHKDNPAASELLGESQINIE